MGDLQTSIDSIVGQTIEKLHYIEAEVKRTADRYLILETKEEKRYILSISRLTKPCPNDLLVLEEAAKAGGAFTIEEALRRRRGEALGPQEDVTVKAISKQNGQIDNGEEPEETDDDREDTDG